MFILYVYQNKKSDMRKITLIFAMMFGCVFLGTANNYRIDEQSLEQTFATSTEVTFEQMFASEMMMQAFNGSSADAAKTRGGYLVRAFFCGGIALHRYYMGTTRGGMWAMYFCIPVVGGVTACVDFWWAVFEDDAYTKYANNDKYMVWAD
jgi:hypothetical protein